MENLDIPFPAPVSLAPGSTRWRLSDLMRWESARAGEPAPAIDRASDQYLTDRQVAARLGVARQSIWRWCAVARGAA